MPIILLDAQGNVTKDITKAVRKTTDNPGAEGDVSTNLPEEGTLFLMGGANLSKEEMDLCVRQGGKMNCFSGKASSAGIDLTNIPRFTTDVGGGERGADQGLLGGFNMSAEELKKFQPGTGQQDLTTGEEAVGATDVGSTAAALDPSSPENVAARQAAAERIGDTGTVQAAGQQAGQFVEGQAYKNPNNNEIFLFKNGKMNWIQDEETFKKIFGGLPEEGTNFTTLDTIQGLQFGPSINSSNVQEFAGAGVTTAITVPTSTTEGEVVVDTQFEQNLDNFLANSGLPQEVQDLIKTVVTQLPTDTSGSDQDILDVFNQLSGQILDPFFNELISTAKRDVEINIARQEEDFEKLEELQIEQAEERFRQGQLSLEASGLSRTGEGVRQLGTEGAIRGTEGAETIAGFIPEANRRIAQSSRRQFGRNLQDIGRGAEQLFGTTGIQGLNLPQFAPQGGITGQIPFQRETQRANLLLGLQGQQQNLETFQSLFF